VLRAPAQGAQAARAHLQVLLQTWAEGMRSPLPLPPGVALRWLKAPDKLNALADAFEGSDFKVGAMADDPALARTYPSLDDLMAGGAFERLAERVYRPLKVWAEQLQIDPLPNAPEDDGDEEEEALE